MADWPVLLHDRDAFKQLCGWQEQAVSNNNNKKEGRSLNISARSFITSIAVIFALMVAAYAASFAGQGISFGRWILSPLLVLGAEGNGTLIAVIVFLLVIGGVFSALDECGLMRYMLDRIAARYSSKKYTLMAVVIFFFMAMGALIGSFEECVPLVPIVVQLALKLGWDAVTGLSMSMLAVGCGFASGLFNPFTVGVAQKLAGLPMFSGAWMRLLAFVLIYPLLLFFIRTHAKKVDRSPLGISGFTSKLDRAVAKSARIADNISENADPDMTDTEAGRRLAKALKLFASILAVGIALVLSSAFLTFLQDYTMIIVALAFLAAGLAACLACGLKGAKLAKCFGSGAFSILPAVLMILMAASIKFTLTESGVIDLLLSWAVNAAGGLPKWAVILFIYLIVLVMNFFIASGSAKAIMLIPLIVPMAQAFGISPQLCILAFAFGDGFSNVFYPTNAALLISLGLADISYTKWAKHSVKFQAANLLLTSCLLLFGLAAGY